MRRKIFLLFFLLVIFFGFQPQSSYAQSVILPGAGFTPDSPWYFLENWREKVQEFLTFDQIEKAKLQISFAQERLAEIEAMLESKGTSAPGIAVAESKLQSHLNTAATILEKEKQKGKDVTSLAKSLNTEITASTNQLNSAFNTQKKVLENKMDQLRLKIKEAVAVGNTVLADSLNSELDALKVQVQQLENQEHLQEQEMEQEKERIENQMDLKTKALEKIKEAEKEKAEFIIEADKENLSLPVNAFSAFDSLMAQAKAAYEAGKYEEAVKLAKQAEKTLDKIEEALETLDEAKEEEEDLEEEKKEAQKETLKNLNKNENKEQIQKINEENKRKLEKIKEEQKKLLETQKEALKKLQEAAED